MHMDTIVCCVLCMKIVSNKMHPISMWCQEIWLPKNHFKFWINVLNLQIFVLVFVKKIPYRDYSKWCNFCRGIAVLVVHQSYCLLLQSTIQFQSVLLGSCWSHFSIVHNVWNFSEIVGGNIPIVCPPEMKSISMSLFGIKRKNHDYA